MVAYTCSLLALVTTLAIPPAVDSARGTGDWNPPFNHIQAIAPAPSLFGKWQLEWDDQVGEQLIGDIKTCTIDFQCIDAEITGNFDGPVAGRERNALLRGHIFSQPTGNLVQFQQHEPGYVCSYQIYWSNTNDDRSQVVGVWHDTQGRSGNFKLMKFQ